jgi:hypothetical protein
MPGPSMTSNQIKLVLPELEAEVVGEALELYLRTRPVPLDHRFEYRYRAAQGVLDVLHYQPPVDDESSLPGRRRDQIED